MGKIQCDLWGTSPCAKTVQAYSHKVAPEPQPRRKTAPGGDLIPSKAQHPPLRQLGVHGVAGPDVLSPCEKAWHRQEETQGGLLLLLTLHLGGSSKLASPGKVGGKERRPALLLLDLSLPVTHTASLLGPRIMKCVGLKAGRQLGIGERGLRKTGLQSARPWEVPPGAGLVLPSFLSPPRPPTPPLGAGWRTSELCQHL